MKQNLRNFQNRKEKIFEAALKCFNQKGYHKTSIDDIVKKCRMSKGGIYYHFKSKEQLFRQLYSFKVMNYFNWLNTYIQQSNDPSEQILLFAKKTGEILKENQDFFKFCLEFLSMAPREPGIKKEMTSFYLGTVKTFSKLIEEGIRSGRFKKLDSKKVARVLYLIFMGVFFTYFSTNIDFDLIEQEIFNINILLKGIQKS